MAAEAVRRSAVLLKNDQGLPLPPGARSIEVAGSAADDVGLQCGGWTVGWQGGIRANNAGHHPPRRTARRHHAGTSQFDPDGTVSGS